MKKLNFLILITIASLILVSCSDRGGSDYRVSYSDSITNTGTEKDSTPDTPEKENPSEPAFDKKFLVKTETGLYFSDGVSLEYFLPPTAHKAAPYRFISGSTLVTLDPSGDIDTSTDLNHSPTAALIVGDDLHSCIEISPSEAIAVGARPDTYTEIFKNGVSTPWAWVTNDFSCDRILKSGDSIFIMDRYTPHLIDGTAANVQHISKDFYIHGRDPLQSLIFFNDGTGDIRETYSTNYILGAKQWQKYGDIYYSENGFTWSASDGLREAATAMDDFNAWPYPVEPSLLIGESPTMLAVGVVDHYIYWVECNTGYLFEYDSVSDEMKQTRRLYIGNGLRVSGYSKLSVLKPMIIEGGAGESDMLYFSDESSLKALDMLTGSVTVFNGGVSEVMRWQE